MARLYVETGEETGRRIDIGHLCILGRLKSCDIQVKDNKASRNNTQIAFKAGVWTVTDLKSSNGTFLNDEKIEFAKLGDGDRIKIGKTVFRFEAGKPEQPKAPPRPKSPEIEQPKPAAPKPRPKPPSSPAPVVPPDEISPTELAQIETPPSGVPGIAAEGGGLDDEGVEELDLGGGTGVDEPALPQSAPSRPQPRPAPAPSPPVKAAFKPRIPLPEERAGRRPRSLFLQDVSQRSAVFRAGLYLLVIALMAAIAYLSFHFVSSAVS